MESIGRRGLGAIVAATGLCVLGRAAYAITEQQQTIDRALHVIEEARREPQFGNSEQLLRRCRAVLVVPQLVKGGFFVGGEGGTGVLLARRPGGWSEPAFYMLASASFGLQIGLEVNQVMMFIMTQRGLDALQHDEVKLGASAGLSILMIGSNAQAATALSSPVDIIAWSKAKGLYGGLTLEGSVVRPMHDWDTAYYGRPVSSSTLLTSNAVANPGAAPLRRALGG